MKLRISNAFVAVAAIVALQTLVLPHAYGQEADPDSTDTPFPIRTNHYNPFVPQDPFGSTSRDGGLYLEDPTDVEITYDENTGQYYFQRKVGGVPLGPPLPMDSDEYQEYQAAQEKKDNFEAKKEEDEFSEAKAFRPTIKVPGEGFKSIFGSDVIEIRPNGSAELIFGVNVSRTDNPAIPEKQRRVATFDFNEKIQLNVVGNIGDKLKLTTNYNTEATFDFENQMKLEYTGYEDEIIQKIEVGNVTLPLKGTLITGSQSLFGIKTALQFGRLTVTSVLSQQKGQKSEIDVQGGAQVSEFEVKADMYDNYKHFFLGHYFRDNYETAIANPPLLNTVVQITRIEVWVTNTNTAVDETRNVIAFQDLGEGNPDRMFRPGFVNDNDPNSILADNEANDLYAGMAGNGAVRGFLNSTAALNGMGLEARKDYQRIELARKLKDNEFSYHPQLGYISVNQPLNVNQVLGVAFQYTFRGQTYQVGDFSTDGVSGTDALFLKMLKSTESDTEIPMWDLMMKNIYSIGAYQLNQDDFTIQIWYLNQETGVNINCVPAGPISNTPLLQALGLDKLNTSSNGVPQPDGRFDWLPNLTVVPQNGRIIFPMLEPFGQGLADLLGNDPELEETYVFHELYENTQANAQVKYPDKNRFTIKGSYKSSSSSEISLNAINIPEGSVTVTAGGQKLIENQDYTVDYTLGRVTIMNQGILESGTPIKVSLESNQMFNIQTQNLFASRFDYKINDDFLLGGTIMNMTERPITQKVNVGDEPMSNTIWGVDGTYSTKSRFLTKMVDALPLYSTKEESKINLTGEFAHLIPGHSRAVGKTGTSYVDDFEGSQSAIDIRTFSAWFLASTPQGQGGTLFPEGELSNNRAYGFNRARFNWYVVDPLFFRDNNITPDHVAADDDMQSNHFMREVLQTEVFPNKEFDVGTPANIAVFDMSFYPGERGPYNYDVDGFEYESDVTSTPKKYGHGLNPDGSLANPEERWGGIMRRIETSDFDAANVEFIQFWLMDPWDQVNGGADYEAAHPGATLGNAGGKLYFNLGNISEDILRDGNKAFENGFATNAADAAPDPADTLSNWGRIPLDQSLVNAFDNNPETRQYQDVGLEGYSDEFERQVYADFLDRVNDAANGLNPAAIDSLESDPSADNFHYFRGDDYDRDEVNVLNRYKLYNGLEGNSPTAEQSAQLNDKGYPTSASTLPDQEDINRDNTLDDIEAYYQYSVDLSPQALNGQSSIGSNYITDVLVQSGVPTENGSTKSVTWYQFKIPVRNPEQVIGSISDFRSIRFMRVFMRGFEQPVTLRFARLDLIRGEWRKYIGDLDAPGEYLAEEDDTQFNLAAVNIEENGSRSPVNYVLPPGIQREISIATTNLRQLNEQALSLTVCGLVDGSSKAAYKNIDLDVLNYGKLKMYAHCENANPDEVLNDDDLTLFIRLGADFEQNYYEYEVPLKLTQPGLYDKDSEFDKELVWPLANNIEIDFDQLRTVKTTRNTQVFSGSGLTQQDLYFEDFVDENGNNRRISVVGNPNLATIKTIMIGVRNPKQGTGVQADDDGLPKCAEIWVNELRLTDFDQRGGWAALGRMTANLADLANVSLAGNISTPGFGSIEKKVSERQRETIRGVDASTTVNLDKFTPESWGLKLPMYVGFSENVVVPQYAPLDPDVPFKIYQSQFATKAQRDSVRRTAETRTIRRSLNFTNIRKEKTNKGAKAKPWDISNFTGTYSYSQEYFRDINTEFNNVKNYRGGLAYSFSTQPKNVQPFAKVKLFSKSKWFGLMKDFNFNPMPKQVSVRTDLNRTYGETKIRNTIPGAKAGLPVFYEKTFNWSRQYDLKWDFTKNLKFDFNANNQAQVGEPTGVVNRKWNPDEYQTWRDSVFTSVSELGITTNYRHDMNVNYTVPFSKIPLLDWINGTARYSTSYNWMRAPFAADTLGHTIQNSNSINLNATANFQTLYNKVPYFKNLNRKMRRANRNGNPGRTSGRGRGEGDGEEEEEDPKGKGKKDKDDKKKDPNRVTLLDRFARVILSVRNANLSYVQTNGILLPGFNRETSLMGMDSNWDSPGYGFIFGQQSNFGPDGADDYFEYAADNGWLVMQQNLNLQASKTYTENINFRTTIEPFEDCRIEITAVQNRSRNNTEFYRWNVDSLDWVHDNPMEVQSYSATLPIWQTAFVKDGDEYFSQTFQNMLDYRSVISQRLGAQNPNSQNDHENEPGYAEGYGGSSNDVLIPAFIAAYTDANPEEVSLGAFLKLPGINWRVTYNGLAKRKWWKKHFKSVNISHNYRSTYSVNGYMTNLQFEDANGDGFTEELDLNANWVPQYQIQSVSISEQLSPLVNVDATWNNSLQTKVEVKRTRTLTMNFANTQLTEDRNREWIFGLGYRFEDVKLPIRFKGGKRLESDLNVRADVSIRDNLTVIRKVVEEINQATRGQKTISVRINADYAINERLMLRLFYDRIVNKPVISTSFPTANTNAGLSIRFTLAS